MHGRNAQADAVIALPLSAVFGQSRVGRRRQLDPQKGFEGGANPDARSGDRLRGKGASGAVLIEVALHGRPANAKRPSDGGLSGACGERAHDSLAQIDRICFHPPSILDASILKQITLVR